MKADLRTQLNRLPTMARDSLRKLWQEVFDTPPHPKLRREILVKMLGYRLQEKAFGGLKSVTNRRLKAIAGNIVEGKRGLGSAPLGPRPGTRLVRQWQGKLHEVVVLENGFSYNDRTYRSLSEVAREISGTRWSGPAFFGMKKRKAKEAA